MLSINTTLHDEEQETAVWIILRKLGIDPSFDPVIPLFGLYPKDLKLSYYSNAATSLFIAAQFTKLNCGTNLDVLQWMDGLRNCGIYIQWNIIHP